MKFSDFGFKENPFAITPDPRYLYLSRGHEESLAHLIYGTGPNGGFVLLTGEVGTGKTLLLRSLLAQQLEDVDIALILNPRLSRREFLATICDELGVGYKGPPYSLKQLSDTLANHLLKTHGEGKHTVLVVDEAQNLSPRVLEQVRLLTNLETSRHKLLRIILVGQPELLQMLARKELRQVDQRITARYHLSPLNAQETRSYITHRLAVAGVREDLFTPLAVRLLHRFSRGIPRLINTICERSLLAIYATGRQRVTARLVWQAAREVRGRKPRHRLRLGMGVGLALLLIAVAWFWMGQSGPDTDKEMAAPVIQQPEIIPEPPPETDNETEKEAEPAAEPALSEHEGTDSGPSSVSVEPPLPEELPATIPESSTSPEQPVVETGPEEIDLQRLFSRPQNSLTLYQQLFQQWDRSISLNNSVAPCLQAPVYGLRCLKAEADWAGLLRLNRPLLIRLKQEKQERLLVLTHVDQDWLLVDTGEEQGVLGLDQLKSHWRGGFVMLWRPLAGLALIGKGSTGEAVTWLRERLQLVDGRTVEKQQGLDRFDTTLEARVRDFQRQNGLHDDGVAGQRTQVYLNNLDLPEGTPILVAAPGQGES